MNMFDKDKDGKVSREAVDLNLVEKALLERFEYDADDNVDILKTEQNFAEYRYNRNKYRNKILAKDLIKFADKDNN